MNGMSRLSDMQKAAAGARNAAHELRDICEKMKSFGIPPKLWSGAFVHTRLAAEELDELADILYNCDGEEEEENEGYRED